MKDKTYYKALPLNLRRKLRQENEEKVYRNFVREITQIKIDQQVDDESEYLYLENQLLYKKLTNDDTDLIQVPPGCFIFLGELAEKLPDECRKYVSIMTYEQLIRGAEHFKKSPPQIKYNQCKFDIETFVLELANSNITWSLAHITKTLHRLGYKDISAVQVERILRNNHIPNSTNRTRKGVAWRDFLESLNNPATKGVIIQ